MKKISIIIPVYNVENYLRRCIESILNQTFSDFELILVDDGSSDNSGNICDYYATKDNRIRVIHKSNGGVSSARNVGIANVDGEWLTFIDADDYVAPDLLHDYVENMANTDLLIQGFSYNAERDVAIEARLMDGKDVIYKFLNIDSEICGFVWNKLYKTELIKNNNIRFNEKMVMIEDHLFNHNYVAYCKSIKILNKVNYIYIRHEGASCFRNHKYSTLKNTVTSFNDFYNAIIDGEPETVLKNKAVIHYYGLDVLRLTYKEKIDRIERLSFINYLKQENNRNPKIYSFKASKRNKLITYLVIHFPSLIADTVLICANKIFGK